MFMQLHMYMYMYTSNNINHVTYIHVYVNLKVQTLKKVQIHNYTASCNYQDFTV